MAAAASPPRPAGGSNRMRRREQAAAYLFLSPYLLSTVVFTLGLFVFALYISLQSWNLFQPPSFVGLANYVKAFTTPDFLHGLLNMFWYAVVVVACQTVIAVLLAAALNRATTGIRLFRTFLYAPSVTSSVVISMIFWWLYLKVGFLNLLISRVAGLFGGQWTGVEWLNAPQGLFALVAGLFGAHIPLDQWYAQGPSVTLLAIMVQNIYTTAPTFMVIFLAALQGIPRSLSEAASLDGARSSTIFRRITLPMLRPVMMMVVVLGTIGALQLFDQVKLMTSGGPLGTTLSPVYLIYRETLGTEGPIRAGFGASMAFILAAIIFALTFVQRTSIERGTESYF